MATLRDVTAPLELQANGVVLDTQAASVMVLVSVATKLQPDAQIEVDCSEPVEDGGDGLVDVVVDEAAGVVS